MKEPEQATRIRIGPAWHKYFYDWNEEYKVWLGTRAMDGAPQETTMLVIVPDTNETYIAVNIQRDAVKTVDEFWHAVTQGTQVFLTYDRNFASEGRHKWSVNKVEGNGSPQWEHKDWMVDTSVQASLPLKRLQSEGDKHIENGVRDLQLEGGDGPAKSGHFDKVRRLK